MEEKLRELSGLVEEPNLRLNPARHAKHPAQRERSRVGFAAGGQAVAGLIVMVWPRAWSLAIKRRVSRSGS